MLLGPEIVLLLLHDVHLRGSPSCALLLSACLYVSFSDSVTYGIHCTWWILAVACAGTRLAEAAAALEMEVIGIRSHSSRSEFEAMLQSAHFVSLHCPLTPKTRGLLGRAEFELMRPGAMVINYARGEVIDKQVPT